MTLQVLWLFYFWSAAKVTSSCHHRETLVSEQKQIGKNYFYHRVFTQIPQHYLEVTHMTISLPVCTLHNVATSLMTLLKPSFIS